jgi:two-component system CheB/CheR fusion protein
MPSEKKSSSEKINMSLSAEPAIKAGETPAQASPCLVVAIGASAGGQEALEQLFTAMPTDCGISFVVVMHLPPDGPSFLAEMLGRYTTMEVVTAEEGMPLVPNRVQVIPAGRDLTVDGDRLLLHLAGPEEPRRQHHPIDRLFRSLAQTKGKDAIAVVLSGFGTDGTEGVKAVSAAGGTVIVQEPASAGSPAMPRSAIATGAASLILPAEEIPVKIAEIARGTCSLSSSACRPTSLEEELHTIFSIVKAKTGHDFSSYKANTVLRRIERRMAMNDTGGIGKYIALLRENPHEAHVLCQDILIGVTSFFRDPEAFDTLRREIIPRLFANRDPDDPVRIWHACCATGEEVYSMAMLIREYLDEHRLAVKVQLFATDIDEVAVSQARAGLYDDDIAAALGEERLGRFFIRGDGHWQVAKSLREMVVFAHHSLIKDPPFSRLDLLVCRNFLIYLNPDMQKRLISLFHQVLKPGGFLFLGSAESVGHQSDLFTVVDKKWKIYTRREGAHRTDTLFPQSVPVRLPGKYRPASHAGTEELTPGAIGEKFLMDRYALPSAVVNEKYEVVHLFSRTSRFLEMPDGEPTRDIMKMAREELRPALRAAIYKGFAESNEVIFRGVKVGDSNDEVTINVLAKQLKAPPSVGKLLIVIFEPAASPAAVPVPAGGEEAASGGEASRELLIRQLEEQLHITHEQLQATTEQLETSNEGFLSTSEELMSINEEFQSANEELQSTNEELETSKEELQALNEELVTVNSELQGKVEELNQTTSNMENLLASSEIATIFLDRRLNLKGFTPAAAAVFNLILSDTGRPFRHFAGRIDWPGFTSDAETVLAGQPFAEREVTTLDSGRCYLKRIFPYRTPEGKIDGIVVTLIDITERKRMEERNRHLASFPQLNPNPVLELDLSGRINFCNPAASLFMESCGMENDDFSSFLFPDFDVILRELAGDSGKNIHREIAVKDRVFGLSVHTIPQFGVVRVYAFDITERRRAEEILHRQAELLRLSFDAIIVWQLNGGIISWNRGAEQLYGYSEDEVLGKTTHALLATIHPKTWPLIESDLREKSQWEGELRHHTKDGREVIVSARHQIILGADGVELVLETNRDITEQKQSELAILRAKQEWERTFDSVPDLISVMDAQHRIIRVNKAMADRLGKIPDECLGLECYTSIHGTDGPPKHCPHSMTLADGQEHMSEVHEERLGGDFLVTTTPLMDEHGLMIGTVHVARDITEQKRIEIEKETTVEFLRLVNESTITQDLVTAAANFLQKKSGCEALGIRLRRGDDYPYYEVRGFSQEFVHLENELCSCDAAGDIIRDSVGNPIFDCMCGNVICERFDPSKPFFTPNGSFWSNSTTELLASTSEADRQARTRNRCNGEGYESVALIPLNFGNERLGLLQLNDRRTGMFTPQGIALWERLAGYLSVALAKFRAEEELLESEEQFRTLADAIPQLCWTANADGWITWYNQRWYEYTGTTPEQMEGWGWQSVHDPVALPQVMERWQASIATGKPFDMVFPLRGADGVFHPFLTRIMPVCDQDGKVVRWFGTNTDISEQRKTEDALRQSEEQYRTLLNSLFEGFCIIEMFFDVDNRPIDYGFLEVNAAFEAQTGLKDVRGKLISELLPDNEAYWFEIYGKVALTGESAHFANEAKALNRWYDVHAYRVGGPDSRKVAILFNDITENKRAMEELQESEKKFRTLFETMTEGFSINEIICDEAGKPCDLRYLVLNPAFERHTGLKAAELAGRTVCELFPETEPLWIERYGKVALTGEPAHFEAWFGPLGRCFEISAYQTEPGRFAVVFIDVTERKLAEEELQRAKEAAEEATRVKSQFLANMSHELRTPMTGVLGMLDLALSGDLKAEQREFICAAHASAHSLVRILNDILDLTKIEKGIFSIVEEPFSIRKSVENTFNILVPVAKRKGLELNFTMADDVPETLTGDQTRLNQILTNLAGNAVKFTEKGKVEISITAGGSAPGGRRAVTFTVTDTGIGIPEDKKDLLFREFSQVDESHSRSYGGTGLGLAISKEIVERMGGKITFTSEEGKGSVFSFCIPFDEADTVRDAVIASEKTAETEAAPPSEEQNKPRLLLAEDDQTIRYMLQVMLQRSNYEIDIAENGQEAVDMWDSGYYDLILMDVQMPRLNGFEATGAIREKELGRGGHIPIIAMTAHSLKEDEKRCFSAGMDAYISKPIDFKACRQLIDETLNKSGINK